MKVMRASSCAEQPQVSAIIDYALVFRGIQAQSQAVSAGTEDDKLSQVSAGVGDKTGSLLFMSYIIHC
jgi:hypothetical protein